MGLGDALGVKSITIKPADNYTLEALYDKIKDVDFGDAGQPQFAKHGLVNLIAFPKIDRNNQVWIVEGKKGSFAVQRSTVIAGVGNAVVNEAADAALDAVTAGVAGLFSVFGNPKKKCMADVDHVADVLNSLGL